MIQAWENVEALIGEMKPLLLEAGIPERQVTMPTADPLQIKTEKYTAVFDWLHRLKMSSEWEAVLKVKKLRTQEIWDRYKLFGIEGLREQTMLEAVQGNLRRAWRTNRPTFFGRTFKHGDGTEEGTEDQDAGS